MKLTKQEAIAELVKDLVNDASAELICETIREGCHDDALVLARYRGKLKEWARRRAWERHVTQRVADIIRGRAPGRL